jgi:glycerol kinase
VLRVDGGMTASDWTGVWPDMADFSADWDLDRRFSPSMPRADAAARHAGWIDAVKRTLVAT